MELMAWLLISRFFATGDINYGLSTFRVAAALENTQLGPLLWCASPFIYPAIACLDLLTVHTVHTQTELFCQFKSSYLLYVYAMFVMVDASLRGKSLILSLSFRFQPFLLFN